MPNGSNFTLEQVKSMSDDEYRTLMFLFCNDIKDDMASVKDNIGEIKESLSGLNDWKISLTTKITLLAGTAAVIGGVLVNIVFNKLFA